MAGIGIKLNRLFEKNTLTTHLAGFAYSSMSTVTPMLVVILNILLMSHFLGFSQLGFVERELFSCSVLYIFIFALLTAAQREKPLILRTVEENIYWIYIIV